MCCPVIWPYFGIECLNVLHLHRFRFVTPLIFLLFFPFAAFGKTIVCDDDTPCNHTIDCGNNDSCNIYCNATMYTDACYHSTIICNQTKHCALQCSAYYSCTRITLFCGEECTINATHDAFEASTVHIPNNSNSTIACNGGSCNKANFVVGHDSIVDMQCNDAYHGSACASMTIDVSSDSRVDLLCEGLDACSSSTINASSAHNTSLNMTCQGGHGIFVICAETAIIGGVNSSVDMACLNAHSDTGMSDCVNSQVHGDANSSINVICSGPNCLRRIVGGEGSDINVACIGPANCNQMEIDGRDAASLTLSDCTGDVTCDHLIIWCPQQVNGEKRCHLGKGDNLQIDELYAVNSWNDVELTTPIDCPCGVTWIYCDEDYHDKCLVAELPWNSSWKIAMDCRDPSSGCYVEQEPNEFTTCGLPEGSCQPTEAPTPAPRSKSHLSTDQIVGIVLGSMCGVILIAVVVWVLMVREKETGPDPEAIPLSEESDAFMQSDNQ